MSKKELPEIVLNDLKKDLESYLNSHFKITNQFARLEIYKLGINTKYSVKYRLEFRNRKRELGFTIEEMIQLLDMIKEMKELRISITGEEYYGSISICLKISKSSIESKYKHLIEGDKLNLL